MKNVEDPYINLCNAIIECYIASLLVKVPSCYYQGCQEKEECEKYFEPYDMCREIQFQKFKKCFEEDSPYFYFFFIENTRLYFQVKNVFAKYNHLEEIKKDFNQKEFNALWSRVNRRYTDYYTRERNGRRQRFKTLYVFYDKDKNILGEATSTWNLSKIVKKNPTYLFNLYKKCLEDPNKKRDFYIFTKEIVNKNVLHRRTRRLKKPRNITGK